MIKDKSRDCFRDVWPHWFSKAEVLQVLCSLSRIQDHSCPVHIIHNTFTMNLFDMIALQKHSL